jgi:hypothetical protein
MIGEKFNNYRFADYKETVVDLIARVTPRLSSNDRYRRRNATGRTVIVASLSARCRWPHLVGFARKRGVAATVLDARCRRFSVSADSRRRASRTGGATIRVQGYLAGRYFETSNSITSAMEAKNFTTSRA